ncbi:MAG: hypothetical protein AAF802_16345 [Planctomycetota bacterium]
MVRRRLSFGSPQLSMRLHTSLLNLDQRMDKKQKKRLDVINKKLTSLRQQLAGSREQADDLDELKSLEDTVTKLEAEAAEIKASK